MCSVRLELMLHYVSISRWGAETETFRLFNLFLIGCNLTIKRVSEVKLNLIITNFDVNPKLSPKYVALNNNRAQTFSHAELY